MDWIFNVDWHKVFSFDVSPLEIFVRGTLMYFSILILLRIVKRQIGTVSVTDMIVVMLLADASQNGMAGNYNSVPDGILLVATIIFWSWAMDVLGFYFPSIERLLHAQPVLLIKNGKMHKANMENELITEAEIYNQMRDDGIQNLKDVKLAYLEGDGRISIISKKRR